MIYSINYIITFISLRLILNAMLFSYRLSHICVRVANVSHFSPDIKKLAAKTRHLKLETRRRPLSNDRQDATTVAIRRLAEAIFRRRMPS